MGTALDWDKERRALPGIPSGGFNLAWEAVERHARGALGAKEALRFVGRGGARSALTFDELAHAVRRCASALRDLGVRKGDRVFLLLGCTRELFVAFFAALECGALVAPLYTAYGPEPIRTRLALGGAKVLVTTAALYAHKVRAIAAALPELAYVIAVEDERGAAPPGTLGFASLLERARPEFAIERTHEHDPAFLHFTSGTTGKPKAALHVHGAARMHYLTARLALDLHAEDVFWCAADPGCVTGTSYGIMAPLLAGVTSVVDEGELDAERWYRILEEERVTVWYTAPAAIRMLMKAGPAAARARDLSALRFVASVGEPLEPEAVWWGKEVLGLPIHDNWWQTETGGILIANVPVLDIKPGSMGKPLPGVEARIVRRGPGGKVTIVAQPDVEGELALRAGWPSMFSAYLGQEERYRQCFVDGLYLTGDLVRRDADGYYWFVGRIDDVIKSAGHLIGPLEVESVLREHPGVAEAAVIGKPDALAGERIKAFVRLADGTRPSAELRAEILALARARLGSAVAPKELDFRASLPRTQSGKLMRRVLRTRELGLPEGDLSTLEGPA